MSIEQELPGLLKELASDHLVDSPPAMNEPRSAAEPFRGNRPRRRSTRLLVSAAAAACAVVLVVGLVVVASRGSSPSVTNSAETAPASPDVSQPEPPATASAGTDVGPVADAGAALGSKPNLDVVRIDARSSDSGTTGVVLVFDGELPIGSPEVVEDVTDPTATVIGYTTQYSDPDWISVCGATHSFPPPGNRTVDVFFPSAWISPDASLEPTIEWDPEGLPPAKIIVCEPRAGVVQVSIWGSASARLEDIDINVDAQTIIIEIAPDPTAVASEGEAERTAPEIDPPTPVFPTEEEVGRPPASGDDVVGTVEAFEVRKLVATGVGADERDWWVTTWSRTLVSGATVFCVGSPTGAACRDDAYLPSFAPVVTLGIGGWPPEYQMLVDADVTVTDVKIDNESVRFDQVSLDLPSRRSIVAIPLPNRDVDISVSVVAEGEERTLEVAFPREFTDAELETVAPPELISIEYGPTPGMVVGDTTSEDG